MAGRPRTYNVLNLLLRFHAFPSETMGKYCLVECLVPPGAGAPPNQHAGETESFFVLEGEVAFTVDEQNFVAGKGDHIPIPDGAAHAFQAIGDQPARLLIINAPGNMHDAFYTGIGIPLPDNQQELPEPSEPDIPRILAKAKEVGMTLLAPAGAPTTERTV